MEFDFRPGVAFGESAIDFSDDAFDFRPSKLNDLSGASGEQPPSQNGANVPSPTAPTASLSADQREARPLQPPMPSPVMSGLDANRLIAETENEMAAQEAEARIPRDPAGYKIDTNRPIVNVDGYAATERTATVTGEELGLPMPGIFFNIPTIINGVPMDVGAAAQLTSQLLKSGELNLNDIPRFDSAIQAGQAAAARSDTIGKLREDEIASFNQEQRIQAERERLAAIMAQPAPTIEKANLNMNPSVSGVKGVPGNYTINVMGSDVPIDDETAADAIARANVFEMPNNALVRGAGRLGQAFNVLGLELGLKSPEEFVSKMMELDRLYPDAPPEVQKGLKEITEAEGFLDALGAISRNPGAVISVVGESLVVAAPSLAVFAGGSVAGTPITGAAAAGVMTFGTTYASVITDEIRAAGIDINDEQAILKLMENREFWENAQKRGVAYGVPIAVFDALSMGLAGKLVGRGISSGASKTNIAGRAITETGIQSGLGASGEAAAQGSEMLFGFRDALNPGEITLEGVAEMPIGAVETAVGLPGQIKAAEEQQFNDALEQAETAAANQTAVDLLNPRSPEYGFVDPTRPATELPFDFRPNVEPPVQAAAQPSEEEQAAPVMPPQPEAVSTPQPEAEPVTPDPILQSPPVEPEFPVEDDGFKPADLGKDDPKTGFVFLKTKAAPGKITLTEAPEATVATPLRPEQNNPMDVVGRIPMYNREPQATAMDMRNVQTPDSQETYKVQIMIVDLADLQKATGDLQPRDRSLDESEVEIQRRASPERFNPERLLDSPTTGDGAPIITPNGIILSGNGRAATLVEVFNNQPASRERYIQALRDFDVDERVIGQFRNPVLVRVLQNKPTIGDEGRFDPWTMDELRTFVDLANSDSQARMSTTESAQRDAKRMPVNVVNLYTGGDLTSLENRPFVDAFVRQVLSPTEQGQFSRDGKLTKDAVSRMQAAILATAYEDTDTLALMLDSTDDNIKAISNAMMATAPRLSQLKADITSGTIKPEFDISTQIAEAAKKISELRQQNVKPRDFFAQQDAFSQVDPIVEALIRAFYNDELTRAKSQKFMQDVLDFYVEESGNRQSDGLFEDNTTPSEVVRAARSKAERKADGTAEGQGSFLPESSPGDSAETSSQQTQSRGSEGRSADTRQSNEVDTKKGLDVKNNQAMAEEAKSRIEALGINVKPRIVNDFNIGLMVSVPIPDELANRYPDQLKTSSGKKKPALQIRVAFNVFNGVYDPTTIVDKDEPSRYMVKEIMLDESIDSRATQVIQAVRDLSAEINEVSNDTRPESSLEASVSPDAAIRRSATTTDAAQVVLREDGEGSTRGTKSGRVLIDQSETLRQSVFQQAYRDAGFDPAIAVNFTPERQFKILSDLVTKKFGFKYVARPQTNSYDSVNALLDAYRNLQWMTHALGFPADAIGLDNSLGLALPGVTWGGYLAAYINKQGGDAAQTESDIGAVPAPVVIMPKRSNSFAHEWGHALDYHILDKMGTEWGRGITGRIRSNMKGDERPWQDAAPKSIQDAMADLINAMFFDKAEVAAKIMELEQQLAKTRAYEAKTGKETKKAVELENQIRRLQEGSTRSQVGKSQYRKDAQDYAEKALSDPEYWTRPTEMFARAFEAYVAEQVTAKGGTTEFITMENEAYEMTEAQVEGADIRLALTYPNAADRDNIFLAMDRLVEALRADAFVGSRAEAPGDYDIIDARQEFAAQIDPETSTETKRSIIDLEKKSWRAATAQGKKERPSRFDDRSMAGKMTIAVEDTILNRMLWSKRGILFTLSRRYNSNPKAKAVVERLIAMTATDPGGVRGRLTEEGGTFEEAVRRNSRRFATTFKQILDRYNIDELSDAKLQQLRLILTADPDAQADAIAGADPEITQAAGEIRTRILQPMYDYMRSSGYNINYLVDGSYMPRMLDSVLVQADERKFLTGGGQAKRGAIPLYAEVIYENDLGALDTNDQDQLAEILRKARKSEAYIDSEETLDLLAEARTILSKIRKLDPDEAEIEIQELQEQLSDIHAQLYEDIRMPFAQAAAADWMTRIKQQTAADPDANSVQGSFTKKRQLPKEADTYMVDFYMDAVESLNVYIPAVTRKVEYERRFGMDRVPQGQKKRPDGTLRDYLDYLVEVRGTDAGIDPHDLQMLRNIVRKVTGTENTNKDIYGKKALDYIHTYGTMALLPRAVLSSIAEPLTAGIQANSAKAGFMTFARTFDDALAMVNNNAQQRSLFFKQIANVLGVIDDPSVGEMVANRLGGTLAEDPKLNARLSRFFVRTKLQGLTNAQRRASMRTGLQFFAEMAAEYQADSTSAEGKARIREIFRDFGISDVNLEQFTSWMAGQKDSPYKMPSIEELIEKNGSLTDMGELLAIAIGRFTDQSIQDPKSIDRPLYAEHPLGRVVYGIQSFINAFTRNVLLRSTNMIAREKKNRGYISAGMMTATQLMPAFASLYMGHFLVTVAREMLLNPDKLEEEREDDNLYGYLFELAFARSGFTGKADPFIQAIRSVRYQADLTNLVAGASGTHYLKAIQRIVSVFPESTNSPNTVAAEYQALIGVYDLLVGTGISAVASMPGPGAISGTALGLGSGTLTSPKVKHMVVREIIKAIYGVEYRPGQGGRQKKPTGFGKAN